MDKNRNITIDFMRMLGIILIILAHSNPNNFIFQLRNFDVVMMVILMALSYQISSSRKESREFNYKNYLIKRIKRLVVPTYFFLMFYYSFSFILSYLFSGQYEFYTLKTILSSFLLLDGFGYVWIIRIYLILSLFLPLLKKLNNTVSSGFLYISMFIFLLIAQEFLYGYIDKNGYFFKFIKYYFFDISGYIIIAGLSIRLFEMNLKKVIIIVSSTFIFLSRYYNFFNLQAYKYPPKIYYLCYGLGMSLIIYFLFNKIESILNLKMKRIIVFISNYSLEVYFWHIIYIFLFNGFFFIKIDSWILYFLMLLFISICSTYLQVKFAPKLFYSKKG